MNLPLKLGIGMVAIYGDGSVQGIFSLDQNVDMRFGIVAQMYNQYGPISVGQSVMYNKNDSEAIYYVDTPYNIIPEDKIKFTEDTFLP